MKAVVLSVLIFISAVANGQPRADYGKIDYLVGAISAPMPDSLAARLVRPFSKDIEKVRAIYSWIIQHIAYNTGIYNSFKKEYGSRFGQDPLDTMRSWKTGDEMTAIRVLHRRVTVCEGYARLFKVLCDYAGIPSQVIVGYAIGNPSRPGKFRSNHTWNAVMIDSSWYLLDATWGSGYIDHRGEFVQQANDDYFLTDPSVFIQDHYPEDIHWTLLEKPPSIREFMRSPFRYKTFDKYSFDPSQLGPGIIHAQLGDTVRITLQMKDPLKDKKISPDPFFDSTTTERARFSAFLKPVIADKKIAYTYVVQSEAVEWLQLFYNDDLVMRYRLQVNKRDHQ